MYYFKDEYLTGVELVDEEHKELFRIIGRVYEIIADDFKADRNDEVIRLLEELRIYTKSHFMDEEEYLRSIQYEGLGAQKAAHDIFSAGLDEIDLNKIGIHQQGMVEELITFLAEWLVDHILHMDKKFGQIH